MLMVKKIVLLVAAVLLACTSVFAQNKQVSGTVTGADGSPIVGATVVVDGTTLGTSTDLQGNYVLAAPADGTLVFSFIGYEDSKIAINGKTTVNATLKEASKAIDDVIVIAFGEAKKEAFTGSAKVVSSDDLSKIQTSNAANALSGKVAGLQMSTSSGDLGASPSIRVRGFGSINAGKEPLWVVDGMPYDGDLNNLNMSDIESMTVLKDAASNALYGARGANGVIMVTTKNAKIGEAVVNVDAKWGVNSRALQEYDIIKNPGHYYETHYTALYNYYKSNGAEDPYMSAVTGLTGNGTGGLGYNVYNVPAGQYLIGKNGKLNPAATPGNKITYKGKTYTLMPDNWMDEAYNNSFRQEYNVNISGATQRSNFYASIGYLDNTGIIKSSEMNRMTARLKADYQAKKWLKVGANLSYTHFYWSNGNSGEGEDTSTANIFAFASGMAPIYPVYIRDEKGNIMVDGNGFQMYDYGSKGNAGLTRPNFPDSNALQTSWLNRSYSEGNAFGAQGFADFLLYKGLKVTINASTTIDETRATSVSNPFYGQHATSGGSVGKGHSRSRAYNLQQLITYKETFGDFHTVDLMLGHEYYNYASASLSGYKTMLADYNNDELDGAVVDGAGASSSTGVYNTEGFFFRAGYDFANRIFVSGSYRRDASSRFHPDHRWGNFWSVGAAWLMNQEQWFNVPFVDMLKVKASYGSQGNDEIGSYRYTDTYTYANNDGQVAVLFNSKGNPNITWETNGNLNLGVEFGLWQNRLYGNIDYFHRKTTDMLFFFSVPSSLGYSGYYSNVGDMVNQGVELELGADIIRRKNFNWSFNLNLTHIDNKVTYLADEHKTYTMDGYNGYLSGSYFFAEGLPLYTFRMKKYAGVNEKTGESQWYQEKTDAKGNVTTVTTTNYADASYYMTGNAIADVYGGFATSFDFYGVDISANFTYQIGGLVYDSGYASYMSSPQGTTVGGNYHRDILDAWSSTNKESNIPRLQYGDEYSTAMSDRFLIDASYLNIQNITIGYTLPQHITRKFFVSKLRIYAVCDNVWYWSRRKGLDPRQSFTGGTSNTMYSPIRTISGGINVTF